MPPELAGPVNVGPSVPCQWHLPTHGHICERCSWLTSVHGDTITLPLLLSPLTFPVGGWGQLLQSPRTSSGAQWAPAEFSPGCRVKAGAQWSVGTRGWGVLWELQSGASDCTKGARMLAGRGRGSTWTGRQGSRATVPRPAAAQR